MTRSQRPVGSLMICLFPAPVRRAGDGFWDFLKWACRGNTVFRISRMSSFSFVFVSFILSQVLGSGGVLAFSVLPSTPEGTRKVPRSGKSARWALRRCYAGDVTVMKS